MASQIADALARYRDAGERPGDMALLLGVTSNAGLYIDALRARGLECVVTGGSTFTKAPEVKVMCALLHTLANPADTQSGLFPLLASEMFALDADDFCELGTRLQGHPDSNLLPGVEVSTGSLGQGISAAVGMALAAKHWHEDYRTYAILGDGEIQEGQVWEAAMFAGNQRLDNLCLVVDHNRLQIDGSNEEVNSPMPIADKFRAFKFNVIEVADGNDMAQVREAFQAARAHKGEPTCIVAETLKGKGVSFMEDQVGWHGKAPNDEQYAQAMAELEAAGKEL